MISEWALSKDSFRMVEHANKFRNQHDYCHMVFILNERSSIWLKDDWPPASGRVLLARGEVCLVTRTLRSRNKTLLSVHQFITNYWSSVWVYIFCCCLRKWPGRREQVLEIFLTRPFSWPARHLTRCRNAGLVIGTATATAAAAAAARNVGSAVKTLTRTPDWLGRSRRRASVRLIWPLINTSEPGKLPEQRAQMAKINTFPWTNNWTRRSTRMTPLLRPKSVEPSPKAKL